MSNATILLVLVREEERRRKEEGEDEGEGGDGGRGEEYLRECQFTFSESPLKRAYVEPKPCRPNLSQKQMNKQLTLI